MSKSFLGDWVPFTADGLDDFLADGALPARVLLAGILLYLANHYLCSKKAWRVRLAKGQLSRLGEEQRGVSSFGRDALGIRSILLQRWSGGLLLGAGSLLTTVFLGLDPLQNGWGLLEGGRSLLHIAVVAAVALPVIAIVAQQRPFLTRYPEIRSKVVSRSLVVQSALAWSAYVLGYEAFFRGFLLFSLATVLGAWNAILITTALYAFLHLPKHVGETLGTIVMGIVSGWIALAAGGFWPAFLLHTLIAVVSENLAGRKHTGVRWGRD